MNEIKHTPGPFAISEEKNRLVIYAPWSDRVRPETSDGVCDYRGVHIAHIAHQGDNPCVSLGQARANATLLYAALDMAEVLEMLAAEADAGTVMIPSALRLTIDAALIKAGRKAAPTAVRHVTIAGEGL